MGNSYKQLRTLAITAKCAGALSILGSSLVIWDILRKPRASRTTLLRILLGMSIFDILASVWYVVGSWAIPKGTEGVFQPSGTVATCHMQGFLQQLFPSAIPMYNLMLAVCYYLTVNMSWSERKLKKYWWAFHILPATFGSATAIYGIADHQFNPTELWCWVAGTPKSDRLKFLLFYVPLWIAFLIIVILFALMYRHVRKQEESTKRFQFEQKIERDPSSSQLHRGLARTMTSSRRNNAMSRPVFMQGLLFSIVFTLTFWFPTLTRAQQWHKGSVRFGVIFCMALFLPLQGFLNALVYKRQDLRRLFQTAMGRTASLRKSLLTSRLSSSQDSEVRKSTDRSSMFSTSCRIDAVDEGVGGGDDDEMEDIELGPEAAPQRAVSRGASVTFLGADIVISSSSSSDDDNGPQQTALPEPESNEVPEEVPAGGDEELGAQPTQLLEGGEAGIVAERERSTEVSVLGREVLKDQLEDELEEDRAVNAVASEVLALENPPREDEEEEAPASLQGCGEIEGHDGDLVNGEVSESEPDGSYPMGVGPTLPPQQDQPDDYESQAIAFLKSPSNGEARETDDEMEIVFEAIADDNSTDGDALGSNC